MDDIKKRSGRQGLLLLPIIFCFFVMGFVDFVGTAVATIKDTLGLGSTMAGLLPNFIYIWFLLCSIPAGIQMKKIGRKNMVLISNVITMIGLLLPLLVILGKVKPSLELYIPVFVFMGVGNTILQIALNPLLTNVASGEKLTSSITLGQFVKALSSLAGPQIAIFSSTILGNWNYVFVIFAVVTLLSSIWLLSVPIPRETQDLSQRTTFRDVLSLLKDNYILKVFLSIILIVGIDVGLNFFIPEIFKEVYTLKNPTSMNTLYFAARALGTFICSFLLLKFPSGKILKYAMIASIGAYAIMMILAGLSDGGSFSKILFIAMFFPVGFATGNVFAIMFSFAMQHLPEKTDFVSALLIMGISGGGVVTLLMGAMSDVMGLVGGMSVLLICMIYILVVSFSLTKSQN